MPLCALVVYMEMCAGLRMNFDKVTVLPFHADGWDALRECLVRWGNGWEKAQLAMSARWLGWRIGLACNHLAKIALNLSLRLIVPKLSANAG
eukprot:2630240-Amphidinium_carterae.1